jgi:ArsR family transcriptional regulator, arsenate/arsenite/antimonite-responsive transcriptional repressor
MWQTILVPARSLPLIPLSLAGCCSPIVGEPMKPDDALRLATVLKALAEPTRLRLLSLVAAHGADGEACICELTEPVGLSQPTVSHHMKVLVDAGLLTREQRGKWAYFRVVPREIDAVATLLSSMATTAESMA